MAKNIYQDEINGAQCAIEISSLDCYIQTFGDTSLEELVAAPSLKGIRKQGYSLWITDGYTTVFQCAIPQLTPPTLVGRCALRKDGMPQLLREILNISKKVKNTFEDLLGQGPTLILKGVEGSSYGDVRKNFNITVAKIHRLCQEKANLAGKSKDYRLSKAWRKEARMWDSNSFQNTLWKELIGSMGTYNSTKLNMVFVAEYIGHGKYRITKNNA